jgi:hypothetical protein
MIMPKIRQSQGVATREIAPDAAPRVSRPDYRRGTLYALGTAVLLAIQEPFSALAARGLRPSAFVGFTQIALILSVPLLIVHANSRRAFVAVLFDARNAGKLAALFLIGLGGLLLYNVGLAGAHPIITSGVLNLSPFWAALVAFVVSRKSIPVSPAVFFGCFSFAFLGAMAIAWSQMPVGDHELVRDVLESMLRSHWIYAIPMPVFFALSGTLLFKWFRGVDEAGAVAANFVVSAIVLIPATMALSRFDPGAIPREDAAIAILMLLVGTLASSAAGRVLYQVALSATDNDNGFVTMFFLLIPVISSLISMPLSPWFPTLRVIVGPTFFLGLALVTIPLLVFSLISWRRSHPEAPIAREAGVSAGAPTP